MRELELLDTGEDKPNPLLLERLKACAAVIDALGYKACAAVCTAAIMSLLWNAFLHRTYNITELMRGIRHAVLVKESSH